MGNEHGILTNQEYETEYGTLLSQDMEKEYEIFLNECKKEPQLAWRMKKLIEQ